MVRRDYGWLSDHELAWVDASGHVWSAAVTVTNGEVDVGVPVPMFGGEPLEERTQIVAIDAPRERFLMVIEDEPVDEPDLTFVSDWRAGLVDPHPGRE
jgi:hypothetical protein